MQTAHETAFVLAQVLLFAAGLVKTMLILLQMIKLNSLRMRGSSSH